MGLRQWQKYNFRRRRICKRRRAPWSKSIHLLDNISININVKATYSMLISFIQNLIIFDVYRLSRKFTTTATSSWLSERKRRLELLMAFQMLWTPIPTFILVSFLFFICIKFIAKLLKPNKYLNNKLKKKL